MQRHILFGPHPPGPWGGAKRSDIIKSQSQSQFQRFLNQTLCVFSQMKDMKHIRWDFYSVPWVMHTPRFWTLGCWGSRIIFPEHGHVAYQIKGDEQ